MRRDRDRPRWIGLLVVVLLVTAAAACDPKPPNDGRDIGITVLDAPTDLAPGEEVTVRARVTGHGTAPSTGAKVGYLVDPGLQVVEITGPAVTGCTLEGDNGTCAIGSLPVGTSTDVELRVRGVTAGTHALELLASSGGTEPTPDPHPPSVSLSFQVIEPSITSDIHPDLEAPARGVVGEPAEVTGVVRNAGSTPHQGVQLAFAIPYYVDVLVDQATWGEAGLPCFVFWSMVGCDLGTVDPHSSISVNLTLVPQSASPVSITALVRSDTPQDVPDPHPDEQTLSFPVDEAFVDLGVTLAVDPDPPAVDVALELTATVTNHGTIDATGVDFELAVPPDLPVTAAELIGPGPPGSGTCTIAPPLVTCPLGTFAPGATHHVRVTTGLLATVDGTAEAVVSADQPEPAPDPHPNLVRRPLDIAGPFADLETRILVGPDVPSVVNEPRSIGVTVVNRGPSGVPGADLRIEVPQGWDVEGVVPRGEDAPPCSISQVITCELAAMDSLVATRHVTLHVVPRMPSSGSVFRASVTADVADPGPWPNDQTATIVVLPQEVDLDISTSAPAEAPAGTEDLRFVARNRGPAIARDAVLTATFPESVEIVSVWSGGPEFRCDIAGQTVTCQEDWLDVSGYTYPVHVVVRHTAFGPVTYQVAISSSTPEVSPDVGPNTLVVDRTVVPGPGSISGTVRGPAGLVSDSIVRAYRVTDGLEPTATATTGSGGYFSFDDLPPGEYRIRFGAPFGSTLSAEWWQDKPSRATAIPLVVDGLQPDHILNAVLEPL